MTLASPASPSRSETLDHMTRALEAAKRARDRGVDVHEARGVLKEARAAFERGDFTTALERADYLLRTLGAETDVASAGSRPAPSVPRPESSDLGAAAGRLAEAEEAVKQAKAHGFNVQFAKVALKQAKRAFRERDFGAAVQLASQAMELCGSTGRIRP